jgi:hypothetical protein
LSRHPVNPRHRLQSERQHEEIIKPTKHFVGTHPAGKRANLGAGLSRSGPEPYRVGSE